MKSSQESGSDTESEVHSDEDESQKQTKQTCKKLEDACEKLKEENKKLEAHNRTLTKQVGGLKGRVQKLEARAEKGEEAAQTVGSECRNLKAELDGKTRACKQLEKKIVDESKEYLKHMDELSDKCESVEEALDVQTDVTKDLQQNITKKESEIRKLMRDSEDGLRRVREMTTQAEQYQDQINELAAKHSSMSEKNKQFRTGIKDLQAKNVQLTADLKDSNEKLSTLKVDYERVKQKSQKRKHMDSSSSNSIVPLLSVLLGNRNVVTPVVEQPATFRKRSYTDIPIREWREEEVVAFLKANGYQTFIKSFKQQCITSGPGLLRLSPDDMHVLHDDMDSPMNDLKIKMLLGAINDLKNT